MVLDTAELAQLRSDANSMVLIQTAQILRNSGQTDAGDNLGGGGLVGQWTNVGDPVPCRLKMHRPKPEAIIAGQVRSVTVYETRFPVGTDLLVTDRVQVLTGDYPGLYSVASVDDGQSEMVLLYCWLEAVEQ